MKYLVSIILTVVSINSLLAIDNSPSKVVVTNNNGHYRLTVDGKEFFIQGAGCEFGNIAKLGKYGANAMRTWRTENGKMSGKEVLDLAQKSGLKVLMGLGMKPERNGFDYSDSLAVARQLEGIKEQVRKYKNHPALLGWVAGNELNLSYKNPVVWNAVNDVAKFIHKEDPNHPVTTTLAGISKGVVDEIKVRATALDFLSIQMYGDIVNLQTRIKDAGWEGPYVVTEWGATGHWEVGKTEWNAPIEQTSSEKAKAFEERYKKAILADPQKCLGSFVFVWEQKQERTPTWYGMFTESGDETETVDVMYNIWNGKFPANRSPRIDSCRLNGKNAYSNIYLEPAEKISASAYCKDYENDALSYTFEIMNESTDLKGGGDKEEKPATLISKVQNTNSIELQTPATEGAYRLFYYIRDGKGHCATANIPFFVKK